MRTRRTFKPEFKAKVVLECISGEKSIIFAAWFPVIFPVSTSVTTSTLLISFIVIVTFLLSMVTLLLVNLW